MRRQLNQTTDLSARGDVQPTAESDVTEIEEAMAHMTEGPGARFGQVTEIDEYVHREVEDPHYSVTETYWFSFSVPEENLHGQIYLWMHPNL